MMDIFEFVKKEKLLKKDYSVKDLRFKDWRNNNLIVRDWKRH